MGHLYIYLLFLFFFSALSSGKPLIESIVVALQCLHLSFSIYNNQTVRIDLEIFPLSVLAICSPQYTKFIRLNELPNKVRTSNIFQKNVHASQYRRMHFYITCMFLNTSCIDPNATCCRIHRRWRVTCTDRKSKYSIHYVCLALR